MPPTAASRLLLQITLPDGARVSTKDEAVALSLHRAGLQVTVTVPISVLEWSVEASARASGARVEDWCDYAGYDPKSPQKLDDRMAEDVEKFVTRLLLSELRLADRGASRIALEWKTDGAWEQAVPLQAVTRQASR
jgi:hypothetical protein